MFLVILLRPVHRSPTQRVHPLHLACTITECPFFERSTFCHYLGTPRRVSSFSRYVLMSPSFLYITVSYALHFQFVDIALQTVVSTSGVDQGAEPSLWNPNCGKLSRSFERTHGSDCADITAVRMDHGHQKSMLELIYCLECLDLFLNTLQASVLHPLEKFQTLWSQIQAFQYKSPQTFYFFMSALGLLVAFLKEVSFTLFNFRPRQYILSLLVKYLNRVKCLALRTRFSLAWWLKNLALKLGISFLSCLSFERSLWPMLACWPLW